MKLVRFGLMACAVLICSVANAGPAPTYRAVSAVFQSRCVVCHSKENQAVAAVSGGLALDSYDAVVAAARGAHPLFVVGQSARSELVKRLVATSPSLLMPRGGPALPAEQIGLIRRWIDAGAPRGANEAERSHAPDPAMSPVPALPSTQNLLIPTRMVHVVKAGPGQKAATEAVSLALRIGPLPPLNAVGFRRDGALLALGGYRAVALWEVPAGRPLGFLTGLSGPVQSVAFRPDGAQLAVAGGAPGIAGDVAIFGVRPFGTLLGRLVGHSDQVFSVAWSPDGKSLATASQDKTVRLWDWPAGTTRFTLKDHGDVVTRVCYAPDGKSVYTASVDHNLRRYDTATGALLHTYSGHEDSVSALAIAPGGASLVSAGAEKELRWWNIDPGDTIRRQGGHSDTVNDVVFSSDGKLVASASADHTIRLWDGSNGQPIRDLQGASDWVYGVAFSPDGKWVVGACADGLARIWETATGRLRLSLTAWPGSGRGAVPDWIVATPEGYFDGSPDWLRAVCVTTDGVEISRAWSALRDPAQVAMAWKGGALEPAAMSERAAPGRDHATDTKHGTGGGERRQPMVKTKG